MCEVCAALTNGLVHDRYSCRAVQYVYIERDGGRSQRSTCSLTHGVGGRKSRCVMALSIAFVMLCNRRAACPTKCSTARARSLLSFQPVGAQLDTSCCLSFSRLAALRALRPLGRGCCGAASPRPTAASPAPSPSLHHCRFLFKININHVSHLPRKCCPALIIRPRDPHSSNPSPSGADPRVNRVQHRQPVAALNSTNGRARYH